LSEKLENNSNNNSQYELVIAKLQENNISLIETRKSNEIKVNQLQSKIDKLTEDNNNNEMKFYNKIEVIEKKNSDKNDQLEEQKRNEIQELKNQKKDIKRNNFNLIHKNSDLKEHVEKLKTE
jgi:hypothetical protein